MARAEWASRIMADPEVHHGDPCIVGTRIPVATIVGSLADEMTDDDILAAYPQLSREDIRAALAYAAATVAHEEILETPVLT